MLPLKRIVLSLGAVVFLLGSRGGKRCVCFKIHKMNFCLCLVYDFRNVKFDQRRRILVGEREAFAGFSSHTFGTTLLCSVRMAFTESNTGFSTDSALIVC